MVKTLIKKQLLELFQTYVKDRTGKTKTKKGIIGTVILLGVLYVIMSFSFFAISMGIGMAVVDNGTVWMYFALVGLLASGLGVLGSVFTTYSSLYLPKDNELLFSMPIPQYKLLLARASGVFITALIYTNWVWMPAMVAYWIVAQVTVTGIIFPVIGLVLVTLFVSVLTCILGFFVALVAVKTKGKSFVTVAISLGGIALYYVVYFRLLDSLDTIAESLDMLSVNIKTWLYFYYLLGAGAGGEILPMLLVTLIVLALTALCIFAMSKTFMKLALSGSGVAKKKKADRNFKQKTAEKALLFREFRHFTSSASWMLNGGFGLLIMPVGTVFLALKRAELLDALEIAENEIPGITRGLPVILMGAICIILALCAVTTTSVSLEGNNLWLLKSMPVDMRKVIEAKEKMFAEIAGVPVVLSGMVCGLLLNMKIYDVVLVIIASMSFALLTGDFGLMLDVRRPNLNWINENSVTKQSVSVLINFFAGTGFCGAVATTSYFLSLLTGPTVLLAVDAALFAGLWLLIRRWLKSRGTALLEAL